MRVGIDLIEIDRFKNIAGDAVKLGTLFTVTEIKYFSKFADPLLHIAGTFAVKEAVVKAFKTGFNGSIVPLDIEVEHENGIPKVNLKRGAKQFFIDNKFTQIEVSITHSKHDAGAVCVLI